MATMNAALDCLAELVDAIDSLDGLADVDGIVRGA